VAKRAALVCIGLLSFQAACGDDASGAASLQNKAAAKYCEESGGAAQTAHAYAGTNGDRSAWLELGQSTELCRFEMPGADPNDPFQATRIYVDLVTLYTDQPTLAGVAYLAKVTPTLPATPSANPAAYNCAALGGTSQFGTSVDGGGWATEDRPDEVVDLCVFPDLSFIDEFGILYYATGTVRGADLSTKMNYNPTRLPDLFPGTVG